jgi:hypothetical protein
VTTITFDNLGRPMIDGQLGVKQRIGEKTLELVPVKCLNPKCTSTCWMFDSCLEEWTCSKECYQIVAYCDEPVQLELPLKGKQ